MTHTHPAIRALRKATFAVWCEGQATLHRARAHRLHYMGYGPTNGADYEASRCEADGWRATLAAESLCRRTAS